MGNSLKIGRAFGIDVKVHWTFSLLLIFFAAFSYIQTESVLDAAITVGIIMVLFLCVLLHEFGHSVVAQRLGIEVVDITLLPLGGLARMKSLPERPVDEIKIAVAGPAVNVVLAPIFLALAFLFGVNLNSFAGLFEAQESVGNVFLYLGALNVFLVVFNMIPAFPMDGGRILRGLLAASFGPVRATNIAVGVGQVFAVCFVLVGLFINPILALIGIFIFFGAGGEAQMVRQRETMRGLQVSDVMGTERRTETVTPYHNFGQVFDAVLHGYQADFPVVEEDGRVVGMITRDEIRSAANSPEQFSYVRDLMKTEFPTIGSEADLFTDGYRLLQENQIRAIPVMDGGELIGMLTIDDVGQASLLRDLRKLR